MKNRKFITLYFTFFTISVLSVFVVSCKKNKYEQFVIEVCNAKVSNLDSVFFVYKNFTKFYEENVLQNKLPSEYFLNSFKDFNENYHFVKSCKTVFCKNNKKYKSEDGSSRFMEFLVLSKTEKRKVRFTFKKIETWILYDIVFE